MNETVARFHSIGAAAVEVAGQFTVIADTMRAVNDMLAEYAARFPRRPRSGYVPSPGGMQRWRHRQLRAGLFAQGAGEVAP